jgi:hypothetical protein
LYFIRKLYIILKLGLFISESGPSLRSDSPIARIGEPGGTQREHALHWRLVSSLPLIFSELRTEGREFRTDQASPGPGELPGRHLCSPVIRGRFTPLSKLTVLKTRFGLTKFD